jgi:two-component system, OmpR family, response regulator ChvI
MITHIADNADNMVNSATAARAAPHTSFAAELIRVPLLTNATLSDDVKAKLLDHGFAVEEFDQASLHARSTAVVGADIVVVDRSLSGLSSIESMAQMRFHGVNAPVVFVNGLPSLLHWANYGSDVVGGDSVDSLASALKLAATLAASSNSAPATMKQIRRGKLLLQPDSSRALWNDEDLELTFGEYRIVDLLALQPGQYFTYRAIYDRLRHEGFIAGEGPRGHWANVRSAIKRIRNKFRAFDPSFDAIENYIGFGYGWRKPD